jgi:hypothetical protein
VDKEEEQTDREMRRISREMVFSIYIKRWDKREADGSSSSFVPYVHCIRVDFIHWFMSLSFGRRPLPVYLEISHKTTAALFHLPPPLCLMCQSGDMKPWAHKWTKFHSADDCRKLEWKDEGQPIGGELSGLIKNLPPPKKVEHQNSKTKKGVRIKNEIKTRSSSLRSGHDKVIYSRKEKMPTVPWLPSLSFLSPSLIRRVIPRYMKRMTIVALLSNEEIVLRRSTHSR